MLKAQALFLSYIRNYYCKKLFVTPHFRRKYLYVFNDVQ